MNETVEHVIGYIRDIGLEVSPSKTASLVFGTTLRNILIRIGGVTVNPSPAIRYLGVMLDCRLSFVRHVRYAAEKAARVQRSLERLMPNLREQEEGIFTRRRFDIVVRGSGLG